MFLQEGPTTIGREDAPRMSDIVLRGPGIASEHCVLKYVDNSVHLLPHYQAQCSVNGVDVSEPVILTQGKSAVIQSVELQMPTPKS